MKPQRRYPIVAIDGPAGSGKSTVARGLAKQLAFIHVDTGALYRAVALLALRQKLDLADEAAVENVMRAAHIEFKHQPEGNRLFVNGEDVSDKIRTEEVSKGASVVSAHGAVRAGLLGLQRALGEKGASVLEGRDIGTVVFPDAEVKIFLNADPAERARRRAAELVARGTATDAKKVLAEIMERDKNDSTRARSPLKKAEDAIEIDTTGLEIEEVIARIVNLVEQRRRQMRN